MQIDLLVDESNLVYAINCQVEGSALHCGALYLEPSIPHQLIRLAYETGSIQVELPPELVNQPSAFKAWEVKLRLQQHV